MKRLLLLLLVLSSCYSLSAQSTDPDDYGIRSRRAVKIYLEGRHAMAYRDYRAAAGLFNDALDKAPKFGAALLGKGKALYYMNRRDEAQPLLEKGLKYSPKERPGARLTLAELYLDNQRYADAEKQLEAWQAAKPQVPKHIAERVERLIKKTRFAQEAMANPIQFEPKNLGEGVNSGGHEYMPVLTADGQTLIFTARREECTGGFNYEMGGYEEDFFISKRGEDGEWVGPENIGPPVNTPSSEGACTISPDGRKIYFTANHPQGIGERDIYVADFDGKHWSNARILSPMVNSPFRESYPSISPDGNTLYFVSRRPGGVGKDDIWYSEKVNGKWTRAKNMGKTINTSADDNSPQIHADDQTLYFSSGGHPGFGSMDLFMSERQADGSWGPPRNLGYPLNTNRDERTIFVNTDGQLGFISSDREGGFGKIDIYSFEMDPSIQPKPATYVRGIVLDAQTEQFVGDAHVQFVELASGDTVRGLEAAPTTGRFMTNIPPRQRLRGVCRSAGVFVQQPKFLAETPRQRPTLLRSRNRARSTERRPGGAARQYLFQL